MGSGKDQHWADGLGVGPQRYAWWLLGKRQFRQSLCGLNLTPMSSSNQKNVMVRLVPVPDKRGGLNGSTQHLLEVYLQQFQKPKSFASIDSNATPPCLGLMQYSLTDRFSGGSIVGSTDLMALHRPVEM